MTPELMAGPQDSRPKLAENVMGALRPHPEYKASGLPWLGEIPAHWQEKRAKYFFREVDERSTTGDEELLSVSHVTGVTPRSQKNVTMFMAESYVGHKLCRPADLVINTMWAWMSALGVAKQPGIVSPAYAVYRPIAPGAFSPEFVDHLLRTQAYASEYWCRSTGIRASRLRLYPEGFLEIPIACPPQPEQDQILDYLKAKDQQIRRFIGAKRRLIELLNEERRGIIHRAVTRGLDPSVRLKRSGIEWLGDVPAHWEVGALRRFWDVVDCKHLTVPFVENGVPLASVVEVQAFELDLSHSKKTTEEWYEHLISGGRLPARGDLIYCRNASVGACAYVNTDARFAMGQDVCLITSAGQNQRYLNYLMHSRHIELQLQHLLVGSTFKRVNISNIRTFVVLVPPREEQDAICRELDGRGAELDRATDRITTQLDLIREHRTRLIADVVTGKLDVRGVELPALDEAEPVDDASPDDEEAPDADLDAATEDAVGSPEG